MKRFSSSLTMSQNKLEWFTLASIISLLSHLPLKPIANRVMQAIVFVENVPLFLKRIVR